MQNNTCTTTVETMLGGMKKELTDNLGNRHARPRKFKSFFPAFINKSSPALLAPACLRASSFQARDGDKQLSRHSCRRLSLR